MKKEPKMIFFYRSYDGTEVKFTIPFSGSTLPEVFQCFRDFLQGCGYSVGEIGEIEDDDRSEQDSD